MLSSTGDPSKLERSVSVGSYDSRRGGRPKRGASLFATCLSDTRGAFTAPGGSRLGDRTADTAAEEAGVYRGAESSLTGVSRLTTRCLHRGWPCGPPRSSRTCTAASCSISPLRSRLGREVPKQLANASSPLTVQLAGEALFVHFLFARDIGGSRKREVIKAALESAQQPASLPTELSQLLDTGIAKTGVGTVSAAPYFAYLVEFARHWKSLSAEVRTTALTTHGSSRRWSLPSSAPGALRPARGAAHLVFPDDFESMLSGKHKAAIVAEFTEAPGDATDVDERLAEIRAYLTPASGEFVNFYSPELTGRWNPSQPPTDREHRA